MRHPAGFDYDYFDNPTALGYRGYSREKWADDPLPPWKEVTEYCVAAHVSSAIDVGCAKGFLVRELLAAGIEARGFDVSDYALSFAVGLPCRVGDIRDGVDGRADAVIALGVLQYVDEAELAGALRAVHAASRRLLLHASHYAESRQVVPDPLRRITRSRSWWRDRIGDAGFQLYEQRPFFDVFSKVDTE